MLADTETDRQKEKIDTLNLPYRLLPFYLIATNIPHGCWILTGESSSWQGLNWSMLYDLIDRGEIMNFYPLRCKTRRKDVFDCLAFLETEVCHIHNERITKRLKELQAKYSRK